MLNQTKINLAVSIRDTEHLKEILDMLAAYGVPPVNIKAAPVKPEPRKAETAPSAPEKGPKELLFLSRSGLERMRVPADWALSREAYAEHRLTTLDTPAPPKAPTAPNPEEKLPVEDGKKFDWED